MNKRDRILKEIFDYHTRLKHGEFLDEFAKFWQKSYNHFNIIMLLGSVANEEPGYSYEEICNIYPKKFAGRTTLISILNEGCEYNFFVKRISDKDHRKHNYKLSSDRKKDVLLWLDAHPIGKYTK